MPSMIPPFQAADGAPTGSSAIAAGKSMQQLILLRWIAVSGQLLALLVVHVLLGIPLPASAMLLVIAAQVAFNLASHTYWRARSRATDTDLLVALLVDIAALTAQLYFSGGISNPFVFLYLTQVVLAAVLLRPRSSWLVMAITSGCVAGLGMRHVPLLLPAARIEGLGNLFELGLMLCFVLMAAVLVLFIGRIGSILRARDARLAALRQRAAEEEHIVHLGLLASGAAHELGTPLSTLAVILGDWQHLPHFTSDPELLQDVTEMQAQVLRCKSIVTNILQSAGETRGEQPHAMPLRAFVDDMVDTWNRSRATGALAWDNRIHDDGIAIVADTGLQQMLFNVLDNALEASPQWVALDASMAHDTLLLRVSDLGPGFPPDILQHLGKPYQSSKATPGRGLGLFLSMNVARALGGRISIGNRPGGGAMVTVEIPLQAIRLEHDDDLA